ncbi:hypothetical protein GV832_04545 [Rhodobacteraceae bacterium CYK-10]|uniref:Uncharacterized protein n=2 Tax=Stagnihabitans tardus TaxID=2699202 RepID=A0AAE5BTL4_9RHOB|nr:hypothetical protein [Stagnihabitans tardus]
MAQIGKKPPQPVAKIWPLCFDGTTRNILGASAASATLGWALKLESTMKKIALATAFTLAASTAFAGGAPEVVVPEVKAVTTSSSAGGLVVPLLLLLVLAAAASN